MPKNGAQSSKKSPAPACARFRKCSMPVRQQTEAAIGVDVGGTRIRAGRIDASGRILDRIIEPVVSNQEGFVSQILRMISTVQRPGDQRVGVGLPGRVRARSNEIISAGYLDIAGIDLATGIERQTGLSARLDNDAMMALLAEVHVADADDGDLALMVTVGTGIGGAIALAGMPWHGGDFAGQFGHIIVSETGPVCNCGRTGCVETFSSGTALARLIKEAGFPEDTRAETLFCMAEQEDSTARAVLQTWAGPMQRALQTLVAVVDPDRIVIGGGLGAEMCRALHLLPENGSWFSTPIRPAKLGDDAGVIGAGLHALQEENG
ncbi:ROK family protein [Sagittula sp. NFXS13]|uniref:ROK family protein n=1 Tax=Sagittula sp. NFXS13 TaxID=2819095 RepID=UPI0032DFF31A